MIHLKWKKINELRLEKCVLELISLRLIRFIRVQVVSLELVAL